MSDDLAVPSLDPALAPVLDTVLDAVVVMDTAGRVAGWNGVAEQTFGWTREEAIGRLLGDLIVPPVHRAAHAAGLLRLLEGAPPRVLNRRIEITGLRRSGEEIPIELSITSAPTAGGMVFIGFLRDITAQVRAADALRRQSQEAQLLFDVAQMASEAESFEAALEDVLGAICTLSGWGVGHAFVVPASDPDTLVSTPIWVETEPGGADAIRAKTESLTFRPGYGLPGVILASGEPLWIADTNASENFPRWKLGFRGAFGFPLKCDGVTIAVLEFFARSPVAPDPELLLTVRALGEQVGRVFERRRREDREKLLVNELNHRIKNMLAVVQAIASQTFRGADTSREALAAFNGRLRAIADAQDMLFAANDQDLGLREVIENAISGTGSALDRFTIKGKNFGFSSARAVPVTLAIHELCTNSIKYGALSVPAGRIVIDWHADPSKQRFALEWREYGGPPVKPPTRQGFGTRLIERGLSTELGGEVSIHYPTEGLICRFTAPLAARP